MKSCDKLLCSNVLKYITYDDMTLFNGIANKLRCFEYAKQNIYFPDGRGYIDFTELLSKMEIPYEILSIDQLRHCKDVSDILFFAPKEILDNIEIIKNNVTGIYIVYSAFFIKKITKSSIVLCIEDYKFRYEKKLTFYELENISKLSSKPLDYTFKIIRIDRNKKLDKSLLLGSLKNSLADFLEDSIELTEGIKCIKGPLFYDTMGNALSEILYDSTEKESRIKLFIFSSTLNAGGEAFYRYDFLKSILSIDIKGKNKDIDYAIDTLEIVKKMWYELARILRFAQKNNNDINISSIVDLLNKIKKMELEAVNILMLNFDVWGGLLCCGK